MSHLRTKTKVTGDKSYRNVAGECRRNQFFLLKRRRTQNIVHRLEHRFHEVILSCRCFSSYLSKRDFVGDGKIYEHIFLVSSKIECNIGVLSRGGGGEVVPERIDLKICNWIFRNSLNVDARIARYQ